MNFEKMQLVAALLAIPPAVQAGSASVINNCGQTVWYASVPANGNTPMAELPSGGYSEAYGENEIGVAIKLALSASGSPMQFEFTPSGDNINYDISNINGNPFSGGWSLEPSTGTSSEYPSCVPVSCAAGAGTCTEAYNQPDDVATKVCGISTDLTLTLCLGGSSNSDTSSQLNQPASTALASSVANDLLTPVTSGVQRGSMLFSTSKTTNYTTVPSLFPTHTHNHAARGIHPHRRHAHHLPPK